MKTIFKLWFFVFFAFHSTIFGMQEDEKAKIEVFNIKQIAVDNISQKNVLEVNVYLEKAWYDEYIVGLQTTSHEISKIFIPLTMSSGYWLEKFLKTNKNIFIVYTNAEDKKSELLRLHASKNNQDKLKQYCFFLEKWLTKGKKKINEDSKFEIVDSRICSNAISVRISSSDYLRFQTIVDQCYALGTIIRDMKAEIFHIDILWKNETSIHNPHQVQIYVRDVKDKKIIGLQMLFQKDTGFFIPLTISSAYCLCQAFEENASKVTIPYDTLIHLVLEKENVGLLSEYYTWLKNWLHDEKKNVDKTPPYSGNFCVCNEACVTGRKITTEYKTEEELIGLFDAVVENAIEKKEIFSELTPSYPLINNIIKGMLFCLMMGIIYYKYMPIKLFNGNV